MSETLTATIIGVHDVRQDKFFDLRVKLPEGDVVEVQATAYDFVPPTSTHIPGESVQINGSLRAGLIADFSME